MIEPEIEAVKAAIAEKLRPAIDLRAPYAKLMVANAAHAAIEALDRARETAAPTDADIERVVKADFMIWGVYGGYNQETKEAEWQRMKRIETESFKRRYRAMLAARPRTEERG